MESMDDHGSDLTEHQDSNFSAPWHAINAAPPAASFPEIPKISPQSLFVRKLKEKDPSAMNELVAEFGRKIYGFALKILKNEADAADVVQDTMLTAYEKVHMLRDDAALPGWLYRIAGNLACMMIRMRKKENHLSMEGYMPQFNSDGAHLQPIGTWELTAESEVLTIELGRVLSAAFDNLSEKDRLILSLRDMEGLPTQEVAQIMEMSASAVKSRLHRARLYLRERLSRHYGEKRGGRRWQREFYA